jgi:hypothetical protein
MAFEKGFPVFLRNDVVGGTKEALERAKLRLVPQGAERLYLRHLAMAPLG